MNEACNNTFLTPLPGALGRVKRSNIIKFQLQSQVQRYLKQTLCVFSQIIDIKHIERDFHSVAWVGLGGAEVSNIYLICPSVTISPPKPFDEIQLNLVRGLPTWIGPSPLGSWGGVKGSNIFKFQFPKSFSKIFKANFVCLLVHKRYITYKTGFSFVHLGHAPRVGLEGAGSQNLFLSVRLLLNHLTKSNHIWSGVWVTHMNE